MCHAYRIAVDEVGGGDGNEKETRKTLPDGIDHEIGRSVPDEKSVQFRFNCAGIGPGLHFDVSIETIAVIPADLRVVFR